MVCINRQMPANPGHILDGPPPDRSHASWSIPPIPIKYLSLHWDTRTDLTLSGACFDPKMEEQRGSAYFFTMKTPVRSIWHSNQETPARFTPHCSRLGGRPGMFIRHRRARAAGYTAPMTVAIIGNP